MERLLQVRTSALVKWVYAKHGERILQHIEDKGYAKVEDTHGNVIIFSRGEGKNYGNKIYGDWNMTIRFVVDKI